MSAVFVFIRSQKSFLIGKDDFIFGSDEWNKDDYFWSKTPVSEALVCCNWSLSSMQTFRVCENLFCRGVMDSFSEHSGKDSSVPFSLNFYFLKKNINLKVTHSAHFFILIINVLFALVSVLDQELAQDGNTWD